MTAIGCSPITTARASASYPGAGSIGGWRFPTIAAAVKALAVQTCTIDGEVIACDGAGLADFELLRYRRRDAAVTLVAFDRA
jgi:hypothetical protein